MSGGYLKDGLKAYQHQVVIFTFKGPIDLPTCQNWNREISALKASFADKLIAVTMTGDDTPDDYKNRPAGAVKSKRKAAKKAAKKARRRR